MLNGSVIVHITSNFAKLRFKLYWWGPEQDGELSGVWQWKCSNKRIMMFCSDWISMNKAHCCSNEHKCVPKWKKNSAERSDRGDFQLWPPWVKTQDPAPVSLLVRIVNLVLLDGRIHITHKSGFVWTMDKKFWMERANEGKFAFVTLLCLSCS